MSEDIYYAPATELAAKIRQKVLSPVEVVQAHLDRIEQLNSTLNAIVFFTEDPLERAKEAEAAVMRGDDLGPLHGVPYTLKDCIETTGMRMSLGSKIYNDYVSEQDAEVYTRLKNAGGILLGKTNMPEFALWWETDNEVFGLTRNPWNLDRTAGGSSGGEVAAIAAGLSPFGLGHRPWRLHPRPRQPLRRGGHQAYPGPHSLHRHPATDASPRYSRRADCPYRR